MTRPGSWIRCAMRLGTTKMPEPMTEPTSSAAPSKSVSLRGRSRGDEVVASVIRSGSGEPGAGRCDYAPRRGRHGRPLELYGNDVHGGAGTRLVRSPLHAGKEGMSTFEAGLDGVTFTSQNCRLLGGFYKAEGETPDPQRFYCMVFPVLKSTWTSPTHCATVAGIASTFIFVAAGDRRERIRSQVCPTTLMPQWNGP